MKTIMNALGIALGAAGLAVVLSVLFCLPVTFLWNWLMPAISGLPEIGMWQGGGLLLLSTILFKSAGSK